MEHVMCDLRKCVEMFHDIILERLSKRNKSKIIISGDKHFFFQTQNHQVITVN